MKILIISTCKEKIHELEFVKPIIDILDKHHTISIHYSDLKKDALNGLDKIIICGTSLKDNGFLENLENFNWIKKSKKPILGICAGFQIIGLAHGSKMSQKLEIGYFKETLNNEFLGVAGDLQVYHLHNNYLKKESVKDFDIFNQGKIPQAIKHKTKEIYGTLFHPEVRNKEMILNFAEK